MHPAPVGLSVFESADKPITVGRSINPLPFHHILHKVAFIFIAIREHEESPAMRFSVLKFADILIACGKQICAVTMRHASR